MRLTKRTLVLSASALLLAVAGIVAGSLVGREIRKPSRPPKPEIDSRLAVGQVMPDATFLATYGDTMHLQDLIAGRKAILVFISTTCTPCVDLAAEWREVFLHHGTDYELVGVSAESPAALDRFANQWGISFPLLIDAGTSFGREYRIEASPTMLGIGADGVISFAEIGYEKSDRDRIRDLLTQF